MRFEFRCNIFLIDSNVETNMFGIGIFVEKKKERIINNVVFVIIVIKITDRFGDSEMDALIRLIKLNLLRERAFARWPIDKLLAILTTAG